MSSSQPGDIFQPGDLLNNTYRIQSLLGRGGTSEVYEARSEISGRIVALKALKSEFSTNEDFLVLMTREEEIRDVRHDAVVRYYDNQRMPDGVVYLVMDYIDGPGLDAKLKAGGLDADALLTIGARVNDGLIAAHEHGVVHRDLSPDNIILRNGNPAEAVIIDFGIAKDTNPGAETIVGNEFAGKYAYAAPEQLSGKTDARSDLYSLGALLLAVFRGAKPDIGNNPMEVVQRKSEPLDISGVPEPLASLISRMTAPNPDERFQTARELQTAFQRDAGIQSSAPPPSNDLDDATVIAAPISKKVGSSPSSGPEKKRSGGLIAAGLAVVLVAGGVGAYFSGAIDGLLGPRYPVASPYTLIVEQGAGTPPRAIGNVPAPEIADALTDIVRAKGGTADLELATGDIQDTWGQGILDIIGATQGLDEYRVAISGNTVRVTGLAKDANTQASAMLALTDELPDGFTGSAQIDRGPRFLQASQIQPTLDEASDCGPMNLIAPPAIGYAMGSRIIVSGKLASASSKLALHDALVSIAGDRPVSIDAEILSPALCLIESVLPRVPSGGFDIQYQHGLTGEPNATGRFLVGENPVIDVIIPQTAQDGFLYISILDVSGNVFHLLPNLNRSDNSVQATRDGETGDVALRVTYAINAVSDRSQLAFLVDDSSLGKSKILVLHSDRPLFDGMRPTTESAASYADAIKAARDSGGLRVRTLDSRILTTAAN